MRVINHSNNWRMLFIAWLVALGATLGALFIGEVMGQVPCTLCWYQRIAMFPLAIVLGIACLTDDFWVWRYALPISSIGFSIALWHSLLYAGVVPKPIVPCSQTGPSCTSADMLLFNTLPLPYLSLICFTFILVIMIL